MPDGQRPVKTEGSGRYVRVTALDGSTYLFDTLTHQPVRGRAKAKRRR